MASISVPISVPSRTRTANGWRLPASSTLFCSVLLLVFSSCHADIGEDGLLSLLVAVPLTENNEHVDPGWMHMASALMAVDHFNTRNNSVVPGLDQLLQGCPIQFDTDHVTILDTGTNSHKAMEDLSDMIRNGFVFPDAIAGPYNEIPALELSSLATGMKTPIVSHRASNYNLVLPDKHPYFSQLTPDLYGQMAFLGQYLDAIQRTDYIAVVHGLDDASLQRVEILRGILWTQHGISHVQTFSYLSPATPVEGSLNRDIATALQGVEECGYRTIIWMTAHTDTDVVDMGSAASSLGLDAGQHLWVLPGGVEISSIMKYDILYDAASSNDDDDTPEKQQQPQWWKFLQGAAYLDHVERFEAVPGDAFNKTLHFQNASFVQKLREANPVPDYFNDTWNAYMDTIFPPDDIFQMIDYPVEGTSYMYDAVMTIGIGACKSWSLYNPILINGGALLKGIQSVNFTGASGQVKFRNLEGNPGSRDGRTVYYGVFNLLPFGIEVEDLHLLSEVAAFWHPDKQELVKADDFQFIYADGTTNPPALLRSTPKQNYLSAQARAAGLALMGIAMTAVFLSVVFVAVYRKHRIVVAAQPLLLYLLCFGSAVTCLVILMSSFDENHGWTDDQLDKACLSIPWLESCGFLMVYCALFTKLWRVNKVLQFRRTRISVQHVMWPAAGLILAAIIILGIWTATGESGWDRKVIDDVTGESIGVCYYDEMAMFVVPLLIVNFIPTILTLAMAWKTVDVDDLYSESKWIFALILVQIQVLIVGTPVLVLLQDVSADGRFIGLSLIAFSFPMTTMGLIMLPKMIAVHFDGKQRRSSIVTSSRGSRANGRVSGVGANTIRELAEIQDPSSIVSASNVTAANLDSSNNSTSGTGPVPQNFQTVSWR